MYYNKKASILFSGWGHLICEKNVVQLVFGTELTYLAGLNIFEVCVQPWVHAPHAHMCVCRCVYVCVCVFVCACVCVCM